VKWVFSSRQVQIGSEAYSACLPVVIENTFTGVKTAGALNMATHIQLVSRLRMNMDISPVVHMSGSCAQEQMFLHVVITEDVGRILYFVDRTSCYDSR